ncbi:MAG: hypothetical protein JWO05_2002 [Gemmatimonadetes bacterium]|nr:hypothetical protein [Gemmatimonadota bacterium]
MTSGAPRVALLVFTCEGREHLLEQTLASFSAACPYPFTRRVLVADGPVGPRAVEHASPDLLVQHPKRRGYVRSIADAIRQVEEEYFFWLEDDWEFAEPVRLEALLATLQAHGELAQVRLSKTGALTPAEKVNPLSGDTFESVVGFSANPSLNRTAHVAGGFAELALREKGKTLGEDGFENVLTRWCAERGIACAVRDGAGVRHAGYLESTSRFWHMTASLDATEAEPLFALGSRPPFWRRALMLGKLARRASAVAARQLSDDAAYEVAFRFVTLPLPWRGSERGSEGGGARG